MVRLLLSKVHQNQSLCQDGQVIAVQSTLELESMLGWSGYCCPKYTRIRVYVRMVRLLLSKVHQNQSLCQDGEVIAVQSTLELESMLGWSGYCCPKYTRIRVYVRMVRLLLSKVHQNQSLCQDGQVIAVQSTLELESMLGWSGYCCPKYTRIRVYVRMVRLLLSKVHQNQSLCQDGQVIAVQSTPELESMLGWSGYCCPKYTRIRVYVRMVRLLLSKVHQNQSLCQDGQVMSKVHQNQSLCQDGQVIAVQSTLELESMLGWSGYCCPKYTRIRVYVRMVRLLLSKVHQNQSLCQDGQVIAVQSTLELESMLGWSGYCCPKYTRIRVYVRMVRLLLSKVHQNQSLCQDGQVIAVQSTLELESMLGWSGYCCPKYTRIRVYVRMVRLLLSKVHQNQSLCQDGQVIAVQSTLELESMLGWSGYCCPKYTRIRVYVRMVRLLLSKVHQNQSLCQDGQVIAVQSTLELESMLGWSGYCCPKYTRIRVYVRMVRLLLSKVHQNQSLCQDGQVIAVQSTLELESMLGWSGYCCPKYTRIRVYVRMVRLLLSKVHQNQSLCQDGQVIAVQSTLELESMLGWSGYCCPKYTRIREYVRMVRLLLSKVHQNQSLCQDGQVIAVQSTLELESMLGWSGYCCLKYTRIRVYVRMVRLLLSKVHQNQSLCQDGQVIAVQSTLELESMLGWSGYCCPKYTRIRVYVRMVRLLLSKVHQNQSLCQDGQVIAVQSTLELESMLGWSGYCCPKYTRIRVYVRMVRLLLSKVHQNQSLCQDGQVIAVQSTLELESMLGWSGYCCPKYTRIRVYVRMVRLLLSKVHQNQSLCQDGQVIAVQSTLELESMLGWSGYCCPKYTRIRVYVRMVRLLLSKVHQNQSLCQDGQVIAVQSTLELESMLGWSGYCCPKYTRIRVYVRMVRLLLSKVHQNQSLCQDGQVIAVQSTLELESMLGWSGYCCPKYTRIRVYVRMVRLLLSKVHQNQSLCQDGQVIAVQSTLELESMLGWSGYCCPKYTRIRVYVRMVRLLLSKVHQNQSLCQDGQVIAVQSTLELESMLGWSGYCCPKYTRIRVYVRMVRLLLSKVHQNQSLCQDGQVIAVQSTLELESMLGWSGYCCPKYTRIRVYVRMVRLLLSKVHQNQSLCQDGQVIAVQSTLELESMLGWSGYCCPKYTRIRVYVRMVRLLLSKVHQNQSLCQDGQVIAVQSTLELESMLGWSGYCCPKYTRIRVYVRMVRLLLSKVHQNQSLCQDGQVIAVQSTLELESMLGWSGYCCPKYTRIRVYVRMVRLLLSKVHQNQSLCQDGQVIAVQSTLELESMLGWSGYCCPKYTRIRVYVRMVRLLLSKVHQNQSLCQDGQVIAVQSTLELESMLGWSGYCCPKYTRIRVYVRMVRLLLSKVHQNQSLCQDGQVIAVQSTLELESMLGWSGYCCPKYTRIRVYVRMVRLLLSKVHQNQSLCQDGQVIAVQSTLELESMLGWSGYCCPKYTRIRVYVRMVRLLLSKVHQNQSLCQDGQVIAVQSTLELESELWMVWQLNNPGLPIPRQVD